MSCYDFIRHYLPGTMGQLENRAEQNACVDDNSGSKIHQRRLQRRFGLLLVSHGSPSPEWNASQKILLDKVIAKLGPTNPFTCVRWGWLEFASPNIAEALEQMEEEMIEAGTPLTRVVVVPVFISVSSHSERDIPNVINTRYHPEYDEDLRRYMGSLACTMTPPMDHGNVLVDIVSDNAVQLLNEKNCVPEETGVLIVAHGHGCEHFWNHLHQRIAIEIEKKIPDIKEISWCWIGTARRPDHQQNLIRFVREAEGRGRKKIAVVSCFNGTGGRTFIERVETRQGIRLVEGKAELFGDEGWMHDERISDWCVEMARGCYEVLTAPSSSSSQPEEKNEDESFPCGEQPPYNPPFFLTRDFGKEIPPSKGKDGNAKGNGKGITKGNAKGNGKGDTNGKGK